MKKSLFKNGRAHLAGGGLAIALVALGVLGSAPALAGIGNTKHNLGSSGTGVNTFSGTGEICVFCHTPHGADATATVPLWNRSLIVAPTYTTYNTLGTSSLDGATAPVGSVSLACLSCHDGAQAMDVMINTPGSGVASMSGNWTGLNQVGGKIGNAAGDLISNLGANLRNDHPIGIQYGGGMAGTGGAFTKGAIASSALKDTDFKPLLWANLNGNDVWWVDSGGTTSTRDKGDMQLYTRSDSASIKRDGTAGAALAGAQGFVECASCHDPHTETNKTFLRIANDGSAVCLACHIK